MGQDGRREAEETGRRETARMAASLLAGRYELLERIGAGASAITWRARDTRLDRIAAVKLLRPALAEEPGYAQRFEREAQLAASISHPNVVDVFDVGQEDGKLYIVMQYVDGEDLKHLIEREGRLSPERAVAIAQQLLDGLGAIHRAGVIHRDIKPQNVLIGNDGIARVTDFGVAHIDAGEGLTSTGMAIGTAAYMAPEQAEGDTISEATDVYAAGVVLYEMLTGRLPFTGPTPMAIMLAHIQQPVWPPSQEAPGAGIPPALDGVVLQAMAKAPADRFRTARAMSQALTGLQRPGASSVATQPIAGPRNPQATRPLTAWAKQPIQSSSLPASPPVVLAAIPQRRRGSFVPALLVALFLLAALAAAGYILANGLRGGSDAGNPKLPAVVDATATQTVAVTPTAPAGIVQRATRPAPTATQAAIVPSEPTNPPAMPTSTPTQTPAPTQTPVPTATPSPTETPVPTTPATQPPIEPSTDQNANANRIVPASGSTLVADVGQQPPTQTVRGGIAPADWQGAPLASEGGEEVALLSGDGSGSSAVTLRVRLSGAGSGDGLALSLRGMAVSSDGGDVPMTLQVNGVTVIQEDAPFPVASPSQLSFGEAVFPIPAANLVDGENTLEIANASAGTAGGPPFIALSSGTLEMRLTGAGGAIEIEPPPALPAAGAKIEATKEQKSNNGNGNGRGNGKGNGNNGKENTNTVIERRSLNQPHPVRY